VGKENVMQSRSFVVAVVVLCAVASGAARQAAPAPGGAQFAGVWTGSWDGAGSGGGFELTLEQPKEGAKDGPMTGGVSVTGEPTYKATFKSLSFDGAKMTAKYDFPPDEAAAEVVLTATFDAKAATGEWALVDKGTGSEVARGGWKVARK
jgi:hypothetical protein